MLAQLLRLAPRRSVLLTLFLVAIHAVAGLSLVPLTLAPGLKLGLMAIITVSFFLLAAKHGWKTSARSVLELTIDREGFVMLIYRDGEYWEGMLRGDTYVHPVGVILRVTGHGHQTRSVVLLRDQLEPEPFRRLRSEFLGNLRVQVADEL